MIPPGRPSHRKWCARKITLPAVALNSVGFNVARAFGPALGGLVIAAAGSGVAFLLNAASFFGVIFFLYRWKRPHFEHVATGRVRDALMAGLRYVRGAPQVRSILIRTGAFSLAAVRSPRCCLSWPAPMARLDMDCCWDFLALGPWPALPFCRGCACASP